MIYCPICGAPEPLTYLRLELGMSQKTRERAWRLSGTRRVRGFARGPVIQLLSPGYDGGRLLRSSSYDICRVGHVFVAGDTGRRANVVKVLGVVDAGKSYLMQSLQQQSIPTVGRRRPLDLLWTPEVGTQRLPERVEATRFNQETCRTRLVEQLAVGGVPVDLTEFLLSVGIDDPDQWGRDPAPLLIATTFDTGDGARVDTRTLICDLRGEVVAKIIDQTVEDYELAMLSHSDVQLLVAEAFASKLVHACVDKGVLEGSVRPEALGLRGLDGLRQVSQAVTNTFLQTLSQRDNVVFGAADHRVLVALTKSDLILAMLREGRAGWQPGQGSKDKTERLKARQLDAASAAISSWLNRHPFVPDHATARLVHRLRGGGFDEAAELRRIRHLAEGILCYYADPERFWQLVCTGEAHSVPIPAREGSDDLHSHTLELGTIRDYWANRFTGVTMQLRDIITAVLVRAFLADSIENDYLNRVEEDHFVRYFLTFAPRGRVANMRQPTSELDFSEGTANVSGNQHLLSWALAKAIVP